MSELPAALRKAPHLARWITFERDETVVVHTGKVEIGQGILTALAQVVADELDVDVRRVRVPPATTLASPDEGYTAGSMSVEQTTTILRLVCADIRARFADAAAGRLGVSAGALAIDDGTFRASAAVAAESPALTYWQLRDQIDLDRALRPDVPLKARAEWKVIGTSTPRVDLAAKFAGRPSFVHDLSFPSMLHGRVVRSPIPGARLASCDEQAVTIDGVDAIVRDGDHLGVVAAREDIAMRAAALLHGACSWSHGAPIPDTRELASWLRTGAHSTRTIDEHGSPPERPVADEIRHTYTRPFLAHASLLPSCAVARWDDEVVEVWTHSQGIFALRDAIAIVCRLAAESVVVHHAEGAGCYGHNGADDVALDAVLLARAVPGRHVRVQWTHEDELGCAPYGPAMAIEMSAVVSDDGAIESWRSDTWSNSHVTRPGYAGPAGLVAARAVRPDLEPIDTDDSGGIARNSVPIYALPARRIRAHTKLDMPVRTSSLRSLGGFANVFAIESFIDELAAARAIDPLEMRLRHLHDERARHVLLEATQRASYDAPCAADRGRGVAVSRYKNVGGWCAVVAEVEATHELVVHDLTLVVDVGLVINPDGLVNQIEGGAIQATSWTLLESVQFAEGRVTSTTWDRYPVLRFEQVPRVEVFVVDRPDEPPLGAGEIVHGPVAAAIANAVFATTGLRVRDLPLTRERLTALALEVATSNGEERP